MPDCRGGLSDCSASFRCLSFFPPRLCLLNSPLVGGRVSGRVLVAFTAVRTDGECAVGADGSLRSVFGGMPDTRSTRVLSASGWVVRLTT